MSHLRLKYIDRFKDRHGRVRYYFRRSGRPRVALPGLPGSTEFMEAYAVALEGGLTKDPIGAAQTKPGTVNALVVAYYSSGAFQMLANTTKSTYRGILENFRNHHGDKRVAMLERRHIDRILSGKAVTPAAARNLLRMIRLLMQFAVTNGLRRDDPTLGIKSYGSRTDGFHTWTEDEIARFEQKHPIGCRARLAFALLIYTAQRRGDVVRMGRQHVNNGTLTIRQEKTGTLVEIPVHQALKAIIDVTPNNHLTFLTTKLGDSFTPGGFGNLFRDWRNEAGLPKECSAHGLRKAAARRLAEAGCTAHQIMSITGHKSYKEVTSYTAAANRKMLAQQAMEKITMGTATAKPQ